MESAVILLEQVVIMFLMVALGAALYKLKIISDKGTKQLSDIVIKVVCPALIFMAYQTDYRAELVPGLLMALLFSALSHIILIALSYVFIRRGAKDIAVERFSFVYSNCAFMGIPLISALFGDEGVLYATAYITFFNIFVWTHGVIIMRGTGGVSALLGALRSPTIIAVFLGILCFLFRIRVPYILSEALDYVAAMNTPLAMLIAGATVIKTDIFKMFLNKRIWYICLFRLVVAPVILIFIYSLFLEGTVYVSLSVAAACPVAAMGTLFAVSYGKNAQYASEIFAATTLLSAVSLPLIMIFAANI